MDSSSSMSTMSFDENDFDSSSEDEVRYVDIEKEILNKKLNDTFIRAPSPKYVFQHAEKENIHQKGSVVSKISESLLRQKKLSTASLVDSRSSVENPVKNAQLPVKHLAYRTPSAVCYTSKPTSGAHDKVKYVATRTPTAVAEKVSFSEKNKLQFSTAKSISSPLASASRETENSTKSKVDTSLFSSYMDSESDGYHDLPPHSDSAETSDIPNFDNIEIIDDETDEDEVSVPDKTSNIPQEDTTETTRSNLESTVLQNVVSSKSSLSREADSTMKKIPVKPATKTVAAKSPPVTLDKAPTLEAKNQKPSKVTSLKVLPKPIQPKPPTLQPTLVKSNVLGLAVTGPPVIAATSSTKTITNSIMTTKSPVTTETGRTTSGNNTVTATSSSTVVANVKNVPIAVAPALTFIVPRDDIRKCQTNNTPLVLSVPPFQVPGGPPITPQTKRNLLMILPQQLPANLQGPGVVNFIVSNPYTKPNVAVQIPVINSPSNKQNPVLLPKKPDVNLKKPNYAQMVLGMNTTVTLPEEVKNSSTEEVKILNTKEKDGPNWCWYAPRFGKRDLEGFLYKDRLGFSKAEVEKSKKCFRKLNYAIHEKQIELDSIATSIIRIKRSIKATESNVKKFRTAHGVLPRTTSAELLASQKLPLRVNMQHRQKHLKPDAPEEMIDKNKIRIVSVSSLSQKRNEILPELETQEPILVDDDSEDDHDSSELYYTKKVVILRNKNVPPHRKKSKRLGRTPKIKLRQSRAMNSNYQKQRIWKANLPSVRKCSVVLERNEQLEAAIKKKFDLTDRSSRKRKIDLESMGLIKKVKRRNAIDTPSIEKIKIPSREETKSSEFNEERLIPDKQEEIATSSSSSNLKLGQEKSFDLSPGHQKSSHTDYRKSVFMSYREYQKILKLAHTEIKFIFALNTIHVLEDLRLDETKPLLVLDQFNYKVDFESTSNYNVVFTRDDDEALPSPIVKNLELVFLVRHGHIKVVSRPVLCKYLLEKCNLVNKQLEEIQMKDPKSDYTRKKVHEVEEAVPKRSDPKENFARSLRLKRKYNEERKGEDEAEKKSIKVRKDLVQSGSNSMTSSTASQKLKREGKIIPDQNKEEYITQVHKKEEKVTQAQNKEEKNTQGQKKGDKNTLGHKKEEKISQGQKKDEKPSQGQKKEEKNEVKITRGQRKEGINLIQKKEALTLAQRVTRSTSHSSNIVSRRKTDNKLRSAKDKPRLQGTDSLDIKFNEIEKNLSLMFEKSKPPNPSATKQVQNSDDFDKNDEDVVMKDVPNKTIEVLHSRDTTPDLDYLLTTSGDEMNRKPMITENMNEQSKNSLADQSKKENKTGSSSMSQTGNTTKSLEKLLVSSPESDDEVDSESTKTKNSDLQISNPNIVNDNIEILEEESLPSTKDIDQSTAESTKTQCESIELNNSDTENTSSSQTLPIDKESQEISENETAVEVSESIQDTNIDNEKSCTLQDTIGSTETNNSDPQISNPDMLNDNIELFEEDSLPMRKDIEQSIEESTKTHSETIELVGSDAENMSSLQTVPLNKETDEEIFGNVSAVAVSETIQDVNIENKKPECTLQDTVESSETKNLDLQISNPEMFNDNFELFEEDSLPTTKDIDQNIDESTKTHYEAIKLVDSDTENTSSLQTMLVAKESDEEISENVTAVEDSEQIQDIDTENEKPTCELQDTIGSESMKILPDTVELVDSDTGNADLEMETLLLDKELDAETSDNATSVVLSETVEDIDVDKEKSVSAIQKSPSESSVVLFENILQTSVDEPVREDRDIEKEFERSPKDLESFQEEKVGEHEIQVFKEITEHNLEEDQKETQDKDIGEEYDTYKNDSENFKEEMVPEHELQTYEEISEDNLEEEQKDADSKSESEENQSSKDQADYSIMKKTSRETFDVTDFRKLGETILSNDEDNSHADLNVDQFLATSSDNMKTETGLNVDQFLKNEDTEMTSARENDSAEDFGEEVVLKDSAKEDAKSDMEVDNLPVTSDITDTDDIFSTAGISEAPPDVQVESDPVIPQTEKSMYLISEKSADAENTCVDTSCESNNPVLQISSSNLEDAEDTSKMSYSETSFESSVVLNEQVTENIINSSSEFDMFENPPDKVADESSTMPSSNLDFPDNENDPEPNVSDLDSKRPSDTEKLLSSCELDADITLCSDEISKNLPDDYLEK